MPYREDPRYRPRRDYHGPLTTETEIALIKDEVDRIQDNLSQLWTQVDDQDDRLGRVERIRELIWEMVRFLFKDGLKITAGIVLFVLLLSGHVSIDQLTKLIQALASLFHGESPSTGG
jgi:hypothetical protein